MVPRMVAVQRRKSWISRRTETTSCWDRCSSTRSFPTRGTRPRSPLTKCGASPTSRFPPCPRMTDRACPNSSCATKENATSTRGIDEWCRSEGPSSEEPLAHGFDLATAQASQATELAAAFLESRLPPPTLPIHEFQERSVNGVDEVGISHALHAILASALRIAWRLDEQERGRHSASSRQRHKRHRVVVYWRRVAAAGKSELRTLACKPSALTPAWHSMIDA